MTPRGRHRWSGGNPISSSLPRHGARESTETQNRTKTKKKQPKADCKLAQKKKKKKKLRANYKLAQKKYRTKKYMMHEQIKCHDACPNAVQLSLNSQIGLSIEFLTKTPKI